MARPKRTAPVETKKTPPDGMVNVNLRIPPALLDNIDALVARANAEDPDRWPRMTRLDWMRNALAKAAKGEAP